MHPALFIDEAFFVGQDVALPLGHRLLLADPDLVCHLESEGFVKLSFDILQTDMCTTADMNDRPHPRVGSIRR